MGIFRQLRWQLTLSYTIVTVSALLVITLFLGGTLFYGIFLPDQALDPEQMIDAWMHNRLESNYPMWGAILSQSPVDTGLLDMYLIKAESFMGGSDLFRIGALQFYVKTKASIRVLIFSPDGVLLGTSVQDDNALRAQVGRPFDPEQVSGLAAPFEAALAGVADPQRLYTTLVPNQKYVVAVPVFNVAGGDPNQVVGAIVILFDAIPTQKDFPAYILGMGGMSLVIFLSGAGILGAIFGAIFSNGVANRFAQIATTTDRWSKGDFSSYIEDATGDEITHFAGRLNHMAQELQSLVRRRQEMAVSEERNRLARDLHDSAKQQALAASFQLGTALALYERSPQDSKKHLVEAELLVDSVRKELTLLVDELRPLSDDGQDVPELLGDYALEWSQRSGIALNIDMEGTGETSVGFSPETRETLFRVLQEALANITRHSSATSADVLLKVEGNRITLIVKDNGCGFDPGVKHSGLGLSSMRERAEGLGGSFIIESQPGQGTRITMSFCCLEERDNRNSPENNGKR